MIVRWMVDEETPTVLKREILSKSFYAYVYNNTVNFFLYVLID